MKPGEFREDLYYRLNVITVNLPPLREREQDIRLLSEYFLGQFTRKIKPDKQVKAFAADTMQILENYQWHGNVRELENVIERAVTLASPQDQTITKELLPTNLITGAVDQEKININQSQIKLEDAVNDTERRVILAKLKKHAGNRTHTAKALGITRPTLILKMKKHDIDF